MQCATPQALIPSRLTFRLQNAALCRKAILVIICSRRYRKNWLRASLTKLQSALSLRLWQRKTIPPSRPPTKPIGTFYTKDEALRLAAENGWAVSEDAGRGYRRVVPSPVPVRIVELDAVQRLIENDVVVVTVGGGGIPVLDTAEGYKGIDAVIDKDRSCSRLARDLNAYVLLILTAVDAVKINFGKENEETLYSATPQELAKYAAQGHFAPGSMLPKVEACIDFVQDDCTRTAIISSLALAGRSLETGVGTKISNIV